MKLQSGGLCSVTHVHYVFVKVSESEGITSAASGNYSIAVLRNKLILFLPFFLSSLFIIFDKCDDSVFGKSDSFLFQSLSRGDVQGGSLWPTMTTPLC